MGRCRADGRDRDQGDQPLRHRLDQDRVTSGSFPTSATSRPSDPDLPSVAAGPLAELGWLVGEWVGRGGQDRGIDGEGAWAANKAFLLMDYGIRQGTRTPWR